MREEYPQERRKRVLERIRRASNEANQTRAREMMGRVRTIERDGTTWYDTTDVKMALGIVGVTLNSVTGKTIRTKRTVARYMDEFATWMDRERLESAVIKYANISRVDALRQIEDCATE